ncbi:MAG TPA: Lrp/AsnC ligand binding domain-containing protein [Candidatus Binatia bacterium]|nr:Lrp/AsnC ligand binding domain-containing protein [Candidatus Binatia bacterium]
MITAIVLINAEPGTARGIAEKLLEIDAVTEAYSVAGEYDIVAVVRVREHDMLSDVVSDRIARLSGITGTETLIAFRAYSRRDLGLLWDIGTD